MSINITDTTNIFGNTPIFNAAADGSLDILRELLKVSKDPSKDLNNRNTGPLIIACAKKNNLEVIKLLLDSYDVNAVDKNGWSALGLSIKYRHTDYIKYLIMAGANYSRYRNISHRNDVNDIVEKSILSRKRFEINMIDLIGRRLNKKLPVEILKMIFVF